MDFNEPSLQKRLSGRKIGHTVHYFEAVDSTNDIAFKLAHQGASEGTVVVADFQRSGKGRLSRSWQSPPGTNIYTSIILRPAISPVIAPQMTLMAGVAVADAITLYCPGRVTLKWPNDVQVGHKKVCGILAEMKTSDQGVDFVILGIGLNVNIRLDELDPAFRNVATSLCEETGIILSRLRVMEDLVDAIERCYPLFIREGFALIRRQWLRHCDMVGKQLQVVFKENIQTGKMLGIDEDGSLLLEDGQNNVRRVTAGDASIMKDSEK